MSAADYTEKPIKVYNREGRLMESRPECLPLSPRTIRSLLDNGYVVKIHGKRITKKSIEAKGETK